MSREYIELPTITPDGKLYHNNRTDTVEALIPNAPFETCHGGINSWGADVEDIYHISGEQDISYGFWIE